MRPPVPSPSSPVPPPTGSKAVYARCPPASVMLIDWRRGDIVCGQAAQVQLESAGDAHWLAALKASSRSAAERLKPT